MGGGITKENGAEMSAKASQASVDRRQFAKADPEGYALLRFSEERGRLTNELLRAATGQGPWKDLPLDKRLTALIKALEYAAGKPSGLVKTEPEPEEPARGITIE